ncbi:MAG: hypothetical protein COA78_38470 [Blastopirellula sp.]|nr:MAG: hypothetical protein COA78_38470 [Blastopirellula sp.]
MNAKQFTKQYPVGTKVSYQDDFSGTHQTIIRSEAWELGHGDVVVKIEGRSGGYDIERITPISDKE